MFRYRLTLISLLVLLQAFASAQSIRRYNTFSYSVNQGLLQTTILDMAFDQNNFCWISFPNGIQKFDGKNFINVPSQPGLPDDKAVLFFRTAGGELLLAHSQGISHYNSKTNRFTQVFWEGPTLAKPTAFIGEDQNVIYYYHRNGSIVGLDNRSFQKVAEVPAGWQKSSGAHIWVSEKLVGGKTAVLLDSMVYVVDLRAKTVRHQVPFFKDASPFFLSLNKADELLFFRKKADRYLLQSHEFSTGSTHTLLEQEQRQKVFRGNVFRWQGKQVISVYNRLYVLSDDLHRKAEEIVNFQNAPVAFAPITRIKEDNLGNLFLSTINNGIVKVVRINYPVKYYGTPQKEDNYILSLLPDKKQNRVLAGTAGSGLLVFDTAQQLRKHIRSLPGRREAFSLHAIVAAPDEGYYLLIGGEKNVWKLSKDLHVFTPVKTNSRFPEQLRGPSFFNVVLSSDSRKAAVLSQHLFYQIDFEREQATQDRFTPLYPMSGLLYNGSLITHAGDKLLFFDTTTLQERKAIPFPNTGDVRCFARNGNRIFIGSNKGVFIVDSAGTISKHLTRKDGLPDECIYSMAPDIDGQLWCSSNKGLFRINNDGSFFSLTRDDGLQENEFNTGVVVQTPDGELFFGGVNGISSFYPSAINAYSDNVKMLLTGLRVNNKDYGNHTAPWMLQHLHLPHDQNAFAFDFLAIGAFTPEQYVYQYKMEGVDNEWMQNDGLQTVRYFLKPGTYTFQLYAARQFNAAAIPQKQLRIVVKPPFWETWWFLALLISGALLVIGFIINQLNRRRFEKKLRQLEAEKKLKQERERISKDLHDSLGAYANAVLYNVELLETEKEEKAQKALIGQLQFASKDIMTALRETVWALNKDCYTAEECVLRIRNFLQPLTRYYTHIQFKVTGEVPVNLVLHYTKALNLVRIVQEAVSNSIKHAGANEITVTSAVEGTTWKMVVEDNGEGFDYGLETQSERGNGLHNMVYRAKASGFHFSVEATAHSGTKVVLIIF